MHAVRAALEDLLAEARRVATELSLPDSVQIRTCGLLLATVLAISRSVSNAVAQNDGVGALILLRSLMEAAVDLHVLADDAEHIDRLEAANLEQMLRVLRSAIDPTLPKTYLHSIAEHPDASLEVERARARLETLRSRSSEMSIRQRFEKAGYLDYYLGPYRSLCSQSHNNLTALKARHIHETPEGRSFYILAPISKQDTVIAVSNTATMASRAVLRVKQLVEGGEPSGLDELEGRLAIVRRRLEAGFPE